MILKSRSVKVWGFGDYGVEFQVKALGIWVEGAGLNVSVMLHATWCRGGHWGLGFGT